MASASSGYKDLVQAQASSSKMKLPCLSRRLSFTDDDEEYLADRRDAPFLSNHNESESKGSSLGNQLLLAKIDKLRELNVGSLVPLPQMVCVGDQSSGKSSVLEGLTGFSFPRAAGLCTRYATQITCQREPQTSVSISIIPAPADAARMARLRAFRRTPTSVGTEALAEIFDEVNKAMGIRSIGDTEGHEDDQTTFSEDILKIEISGPNESHLTVIDVPGIFKNATPGLTTENDIELVRSMVQRYMRDPRTIILAVIPCNVDIATQEVLKLAVEADPDGIRTMGVLTKPDLAIEKVTQNNAIDLLLSKRNDLRLGYTVVRNRGGDDLTSSLAKRHGREKSFFRKDPWSSVDPNKLGIEALKRRVSELLMDISKREFANVKNEISEKLANCRSNLKDVGPSRCDNFTQRIYLGQLAEKFNRTVNHALQADYTEDPILTERQDMRLITRIVQLNEVFSHTFELKGHTRYFEGTEGEEQSKTSKSGAFFEVDFEIPLDAYPEIMRIPSFVYDDFECPDPSKESLMSHIEEVFKDSRGPEIGTFNGTIIGTTFKEQSIKWEQLVLSHVSNAVAVVHHFITELVAAVVTERNVRAELWDNILVDGLRASYERALDHACWLLKVEREGKPTTYNQFFNAALHNSRIARLQEAFGAIASERIDGAAVVSLEAMRYMSIDKTNPQQAGEEIHDILKAYYEVSRKRFVDIVCQQVVDHYLLSSDKSPLRIFSSALVMGLSDNQLEMIAGEDAGTKRRRQMLLSEIDRLEAALKVLRS